MFKANLCTISNLDFKGNKKNLNFKIVKHNFVFGVTMGNTQCIINYLLFLTKVRKGNCMSIHSNNAY